MVRLGVPLLTCACLYKILQSQAGVPGKMHRALLYLLLSQLTSATKCTAKGERLMLAGRQLDARAHQLWLPRNLPTRVPRMPGN